MSLAKPFPVKLTKEQKRQLEQLKKETGYPVGTILRVVTARFLSEFAGRPEGVQRLFLEVSSAEKAAELETQTEAEQAVERRETRRKRATR